VKNIVMKITDVHSLQIAIDRLRSVCCDTPMQVTIEPWKKKRSSSQNAKLWSSVIGDFQKQGRINGELFEAEDWHYFLKKHFLPSEFIEGETLDGYVKWSAVPDGSMRLIGSTTQLTTKGKSNYLEACYAFGVSELDIKFTISQKEAAMLGWSA